MKFIPFSVFILIPGLELLLPPFLMIFPNTVPSQFMSKEARDKKFLEASERRDKAATFLNATLPKILYALEKDEDLIPDDLELLKNLKSDLKNKYVLPSDLLRYRGIFKRYCQFKYIKIETL